MMPMHHQYHRLSADTPNIIAHVHDAHKDEIEREANEKTGIKY